MSKEPVTGLMAAKRQISFHDQFIQVNRAMFEDAVYVRWNQIRAISGAVNGQDLIEGASTLYLEGELGFIVNHTQEEIFQLIAEAQNASA